MQPLCNKIGWKLLISFFRLFSDIFKIWLFSCLSWFDVFHRYSRDLIYYWWKNFCKSQGLLTANVLKKIHFILLYTFDFKVWEVWYILFTKSPQIPVHFRLNSRIIFSYLASSHFLRCLFHFFSLLYSIFQNVSCRIYIFMAWLHYPQSCVRLG